MGKHQVSFFVDDKLFEEFAIKCIKLKKKHTPVLVELIKEFVKK